MNNCLSVYVEFASQDETINGGTATCSMASWGDKSLPEALTQATHTYAISGVYTITRLCTVSNGPETYTVIVAYTLTVPLQQPTPEAVPTEAK